MSQIIAFCPACQKKYQIDPNVIGKVLQCRACQAMFAIDAPEKHVSGTAIATGNPTQPGFPTQDFTSPNPIDPLALPPGSSNDLGGQSAQQPFPGAIAPQVHPGNAGPASIWKETVKQHHLQQAVRGGDRAMLLLGSFLLIIGIVVNMLPMAGTQVPLFRGKGSLGPIMGMIMGLGGAGLLAAGLRHFRMASLISGASGGIFILLIFLLSTAIGREKNNTLMVAAVAPAQISSVRGPWYAAYPEWTGFGSQRNSPSSEDQWRRMESFVSGISATLPGKPDRQERQLKIHGKNVTANAIETRDQQQSFRISTFDYPEPGESDTEKLDSVEKALGEVSRGKNRAVDSFPAREYIGLGQHGAIVVVGETIVIVHCEGEPTLIPGEISNKLLGSIMVDPSSRQDLNNEFKDAALPPGGPQYLDSRHAPPIALTSEEKSHESLIIQYMRFIESEMIEKIHSRSTMNFASHYLTVSAGEDIGSRRYLASSEKDPIIGVDFVVTKSGKTFAFASIVPVFDTTQQNCQLEARPGYALSGIRVNAQTHVEGIKFVFSKVTDKGFDDAQSYESEWYGTPAAGIGQVLSGDGRPVYGFWMCKGQTMRSIGLIREKR